MIAFRRVIKEIIYAIDGSGRLFNKTKKVVTFLRSFSKPHIGDVEKVYIPHEDECLIYSAEDWLTLKNLPQHQKLQPSAMQSVLLVTYMVLDWDTFEPTYGGGQRYLFELARVLTHLGFSVTIVQSANVDKPLSRAYFGHEVLLMPASYNGFGFLTGLNKQVAGIAQSYNRIIYFMPESAAPEVRPDGMVISHGIWFDHENYPNAKFRTSEWCRLLKTAFTETAHLVSVDVNTINFIRCLWPQAASRTHYIPNFYDPNLFYPAPEKRKSDRLVVLFPRRAQVNRGSDIFGDIVKRIPHDVTILWVGKGDEWSNQTVADVCATDARCKFYGADFTEIVHYYQQADIAVIPTLACEGTSLSCIEALASGCAVVATNAGGLSDLIINGYNGLLVMPDPKEIADAINALIEDKALRDRLQSEGPKSCQVLQLHKWRNKWVKTLREIEWITEEQQSYWNRLSETRSRKRLAVNKAQRWVILTRNAIHGGVESLIREEAEGLNADVVVCGGLDQRATVPFLYRRADTPVVLARILSDYDAILYHWLPSWAINTIRESGKKSVEFIHRTDTMEGDKSVPDALVSHSEFLAEHVAKVTGRTCSIIPHPIPKIFVPAPELGNSVGAIGVYNSLKATDDVITAWSQCGEEFPQLTLEFYGEGEREKLVLLAKELGVQVRLNPPTLRPWDALRRYRLIVMPSRVEGFPVSILEALAMNIPVISSDLPGAREFNRLAEQRGFLAPLMLTPVDDPKQLSQAMREALLKTPRMNTAEYIKEYYTQEQHVSAIRSALEVATRNQEK